MILSAAPKTHLPINTTTTTLTQQPPTKSLTPFFSSSYKRNNASSSSLTNQTSQDPNPSPNSNTQIQHQVNHGCNKEDDDDENLVVSASAIAEVIRKASTISSVEFVQKIEKDGSIDRPSSDFLQLCSEQLDLFRKIVDRDTLLSVYVRPAGSYVMDRLELHRVTFHPSSNVAETAEIVALIGTFHIPTGLRVAEIALSNLQAEVIHECKAVVFPMVKHPFVVGFLVAEFPKMDFDTSKNIGNGQDLQLCTPQESYALPLHSERRRWDLKAFQEGQLEAFGRFTAEQKSSVINISRTLAMAYVMDQKAILLQQSSWQNNIRMSDLVEQIRGSLSSIRSLSKMLSIHTKKSEISYDIIEDILVQGEQMRDTLQQLQDAVYLTKANIVQYNDDPVKRLKRSATYVQPNEPGSPHLLDNLPSGIHSDKTKQLSAIGRDLELPMPPLALVPLRQHEIRPSNVFDVLEELVGAAEPLAHKLERKVELSQISNSSSSSSLVAVEESALRQALSNLIEGGLLRTHVNGKVEIVSTGAPAGGVLVVIDDDGPDMHYMTQMHSLTPFGPDLFTDGVIEDNMTWNFISGLTVAREILESYGCVLRVISPRAQDAVFGAGGTRIEIWLPCHTTNSDKSTNEENLS